jgi:hypothetical protein
MATVGGDWLEIKASHPTLGEHVFYPKANDGNTFDPGGIRTNDDVNQVTGSGQAIWQKNMTRGFLEVVVENDMNTRQDWLFAKNLAASPVEASFVASHSNGSIWGISGMPVGDIAPDTNASTFTLKIAFSGKANKIA